MQGRNAVPTVAVPKEQHAELGLAKSGAFASTASNTGLSSPGELEMTLSTSDVAVCCSSDSERSSVRWRSSLSSRVFFRSVP